MPLVVVAMSGRMTRFEHGGNVHVHEGALDFSANLSPLGMPAGVVEALREAAPRFDVYPDPHCRELRAAIARAEGVPEGWVCVGAGATDIMTRTCLALRPRVVTVCAPCYSGYEQAAEQAGARVARHRLLERDGFQLTGSLARGLDPGTDVLFLANPNNPTGLCIPEDALQDALGAAAAVGAAVVLDECFIDLSDGESAKRLLPDNPHLVLMKAFTKTYALAGLRLGYALCADAQLTARLRDAGQMWAVSAPAQVAGLAALRDPGYVPAARAAVSAARGPLARGLRALGLQVVPGRANYLLFRSARPLYDELLARGILIRRCENYHGLGEGWYRVAVRPPAENERLLAALEEVLS